MIRLIAIFCLFAAPALAGPWMRSEGAQFLSLSLEAGFSGAAAPAYGSLYYEYGWSPRLTLGLEAGGQQAGQKSALFFARTPLWRSRNGDRLAFTLAVGRQQSTGSHSAMAIRPALSWGRGLDGISGSWLAVDLSHQWLAGGAPGLSKIEGSLGLPWRRNLQVLVQMTAERGTGQSWSGSVTPRLIWKMRGDLELVAGVKLHEDGSAALKLSVWQSF